MTDTDTPALTPELVQGVPLQSDAALVPRPVRVNLPALGPNPSSWDLIEHAAMLSRMVAGTEFVPAKFRGRPAAVAGTMLLGQELGLGPMAALRGMHVTEKGEILMAAQTMRALVRRAGHRIWPGEHTSTRSTWNGIRRDDPDHEYSVTWTIDDAKQAHLIRDKSAWLTTPRAMLSARASAELCRMLAEDALAGVAAYTPEEIADGLDTVRDVTPDIDGGAAPAGHEPPPDDGTPPPATQPRRRARSQAAITAPQASLTPATASGTQSPTPPAPGASQAVPTTLAALLEADGDALEAKAAQERAAQPPETRPMIPVPGDDVDPAPPHQQVERRAQPRPATDDIDVPDVELPDRVRNLVIACRELDLDRAQVALAISEQRTSSTRELTVPELGQASDIVRGIGRGELRLVLRDYLPRFEEVPDGELVVTLRDSFVRLMQSNRTRAAHVLAEAGWVEANGSVSLWFQQQQRGKLLSLLAMTRAALSATEEPA